MHNYIMDNSPSDAFINGAMRDVLKSRFLDNRIYIFNADKEIKRTPYAFVNRMKTGDSIIGWTDFHDEDEIERLGKLLIELMKKDQAINVYILLSEEKFRSLEDAFNKYMELPCAFVQDTDCAPEKYKALLNRELEMAMSYHCVYRIYNGNPMVDKRLLTRAMIAPATAS